MKKRSALIFGLLAALLALSMVLTGCPTDAEDDGGGYPKFPAAWIRADESSQWWRVENLYPAVGFYNVPGGGGSMTYYADINSGTLYNLKSFTGDGASTGSFTVKQYDPYQSKEVGDELTVTYTYNATGPTITLVSADIGAFGGTPGKTYSKYTP